MNRWEDKTMNGRTSSDNHSTGNSRKARVVFLSLLIAAGTCAGRQAQPGPTRRIPPASQLKLIQLPDASMSSAVSVEQALLGLRSLEALGNQRLDVPKISQLAWAIQKATVAPGPNPLGPAAAPTELVAMKAYFVLPDGLYLYNPLEHTLQQINNEDMREAMAAALMNQTGAPTGGCQIILAASPQDFGKRYGARARTVMLLQAGQMSRNLQLEAVAQGLTFISIDAVDAAAIRRVTRILRTLEPVYAAFVGYPAGQAPSTTGDQARTSQATALLVVLPQGFQDEELMMTKRALEQAGVQVLIASTRMGGLTGMLGGTIRADLLVNQANLDNFNAVVFIGGVGTIESLNNPTILGLARQAATKRKVLAAIGTAPSILASAGVLKGARVTAYISEQGRIAQGGAMYTGNPVEKDGLAITATGPQAVPRFAQAILDTLAEAGQSAKH
jgi:protease I